MNTSDSLLSDAYVIAPPLEVRLAPADASSGILTGYASTFNGPLDTYGGVFAPGAFTNTLSRHNADRTTPAMLWGHNPTEPIGKWVSLKQDERGLHVRGEVNQQTQRGRESLALMKQGAVTGLSIGFIIPKDGRKWNRDGTFTLTEVDLLEISLTPVPSNSAARITDVRSIGSARQFEEFLHTAGFAIAAARKIASGGWSALASAANSAAEDAIATGLADRIASATQRLSAAATSSGRAAGDDRSAIDRLKLAREKLSRF